MSGYRLMVIVQDDWNQDSGWVVIDYDTITEMTGTKDTCPEELFARLKAVVESAKAESFPRADRMITPNAACGSKTYVVLAQEDTPEKRWFIACQTTNAMLAVSKRDEYAREAFPVRMVEVVGR